MALAREIDEINGRGDRDTENNRRDETASSSVTAAAKPH